MHLLALTFTVIVVAQNPDADRCEPGLCGGSAMVSAFRQAVRRVLGSDTRIQAQRVSNDPPDDEAVARARESDGVVELSFSPDGRTAHLHCYVAREKRWLDREIGFGERRGGLESEINERGRLLGFAVATMYAGDNEETKDTPAEPERPAPPPAAPPAPSPVPNVAAPAPAPPRTRTEPAHAPKRLVEFAGVVSAGLGGTAGGLGASAGLRFGLAGPVWGRLFVSGRSGNIPEAQASTRTALMGGGVAFAFLPDPSSFELGTRFDLFASYFDASHLSEDDTEPDRRSRWQGGGDWVLEGGWRFTRSAGLFLGAGVEATLGKTEIYTHHRPVAVVPPFRVAAELGFRTRF